MKNQLQFRHSLFGITLGENLTSFRYTFLKAILMEKNRRRFDVHF